MPIAGLVLGGVDPNQIAIVLRASQASIPALTMNVGIFLGHVIAFLLLMVAASTVAKTVIRGRRAMQRLETARPGLTTTEKLLIEIRDAIKAK
jgi:large conductance mechanosensitive channel